MALNLWVKGFIIGFSIAAPVGPIGILCIRRTLLQGRLSGLISGLGAAFADAVYGSIAGFGLVVITGFLIDQQLWLRTIGGGFLLVLGLKTFISKPTQAAVIERSNTLWGDFISTFTLTITNPMTILSFAAIFAGLGLGSVGDNYFLVIIFIVGVFSGSMSWWTVVSSVAGRYRKKFNALSMLWINRVSGIIIFCFGLIAWFSLFSL